MTAHIMQYPGSVTTIFGSLPSTYRTMNTGAIRRTWKEERVTPERCTFCKGTLHEGKTEFIAQVGDEIIVIRDVPALICDRCGEAHYSSWRYPEVIPKPLYREGNTPSRSLPRVAIPGGKPCQRFDAI